MINKKSQMQYNPNFFNPTDLEDAKRIVLGFGHTENTNRWPIETEWNKNLFKSRNFLNKNSIVLDWGVGIGRLSKMIIDTYGCKVVGVDINENMLSYARTYVNSDKFTGMLVSDFKNTNLKFTNAIAVWALQHSVESINDIQCICDSLTDNGQLFVFEENNPCIPVIIEDVKQWFLLRDSNKLILEKEFSTVVTGLFPSSLNIAENSNAWWGFFKKV